MSKKNQQNKEKARNSVKVSFTSNGWDDYDYWKHNDPAMLEKVDSLIKECLRTPFTGTGKPESLKESLSGLWSRRINREHRLVYLFEGGTLTILQCRFHYE